MIKYLLTVAAKLLGGLKTEDVNTIFNIILGVNVNDMEGYKKFNKVVEVVNREKIVDKDSISIIQTVVQCLFMVLRLKKEL